MSLYNVCFYAIVALSILCCYFIHRYVSKKRVEAVAKAAETGNKTKNPKYQLRKRIVITCLVILLLGLLFVIGVYQSAKKQEARRELPIERLAGTWVNESISKTQDNKVLNVEEVLTFADEDKFTYTITFTNAAGVVDTKATVNGTVTLDGTYKESKKQKSDKSKKPRIKLSAKGAIVAGIFKGAGNSVSQKEYVLSEVTIHYKYSANDYIIELNPDIYNTDASYSSALESIKDFLKENGPKDTTTKFKGNGNKSKGSSRYGRKVKPKNWSAELIPNKTFTKE